MYYDIYIYIYVYMHHQLTNLIWYLDAFENGGLTMIYQSYVFKTQQDWQCYSKIKYN